MAELRPLRISAVVMVRYGGGHRAELTLLSFLSPTQKRSYKSYNTFQVIGSHGTLYRINCEHFSGNVDWFNDVGTHRGTLCGHSDRDWRDESIPCWDHYLAQMLSLVTDEIAWLRIAHLMNGEYPPVYYRNLTTEQAERLAYQYCHCDITPRYSGLIGIYCRRCDLRVPR